mgnify:CR=1 FL=1
MFEINEQKKQKIESCLAQLSVLDRQIVSTPYFTNIEISSLIKYCSQITFREANSITNTGVAQEFFVCFPAPKTGAMRKCINHFNVMFALSGIQHYFSAPMSFNDIAAQPYKKGSNGIGIHRDGLRYRDLVLIICLSGRSELFTADNREGMGAQLIDDTPGRLVMMSGPGFKNLSDPKSRPMHGVRNITEGRLSLGLRCDSKKSNFD